jgi:hypothetical protein
MFQHLLQGSMHQVQVKSESFTVSPGQGSILFRDSHDFQIAPLHLPQEGYHMGMGQSGDPDPHGTFIHQSILATDREEEHPCQEAGYGSFHINVFSRHGNSQVLIQHNSP